MAKITKEKDLFSDAFTEINKVLSILVKNSNAVNVSDDDILQIFLLRGYLNYELGNLKNAKLDYENCKKYDEHNLKVNRNLRRIEKNIKENSNLSWMQIPLILVAVFGLIATCVGYWLNKLGSVQFTTFAPICFIFIVLGILLPLIKSIKIGKGNIEMEFDKNTGANTKGRVINDLER